MRPLHRGSLAATLLIGALFLTGGSVLAQGVATPVLPTPAIGTDATMRDYLQAARTALVAGRAGEAQQALEMAETRVLDRSVALGQTDTPITSPVITRITEARQAVIAGRRADALQIIDATLAP